MIFFLYHIIVISLHLYFLHICAILKVSSQKQVEHTQDSWNFNILCESEVFLYFLDWNYDPLSTKCSFIILNKICIISIYAKWIVNLSTQIIKINKGDVRFFPFLPLFYKFFQNFSPFPYFSLSFAFFGGHKTINFPPVQTFSRSRFPPLGRGSIVHIQNTNISI